MEGSLQSTLQIFSAPEKYFFFFFFSLDGWVEVKVDGWVGVKVEDDRARAMGSGEVLLFGVDVLNLFFRWRRRDRLGSGFVHHLL